MALSRVGETVRRGSAFLEDHPIVRWFVVPVLAMAGFVAFVTLVFARPTAWETLQVVGTYLVLSFAVVGVGLAVGRLALSVRR